MDRRMLEECLRIYPGIDDEIKRIENEIRRLETVVRDYRLIDCDKFSGIEHVITGVIDAANSAMQNHMERLQQLHEIKAKIEKTLTKLTPEQRKIIELRHWNGKYRPTKWRAVAKKLNYHQKSAERIYRNIIDKIAFS